ncbi:MAG TPA: ABC transporter substrate-binding protein [Nitrososphaerales archaeon]|nr:ABC transporter substrate-binding protein [Nitrososphaerales archaeon]
MRTYIGIVGMIIVAIIVGAGVYAAMASVSSPSTKTTTVTQATTVTSGGGGATVTTTVTAANNTSGGGRGISSPIKIGVLEPLSGALAGPGQGIVDAIKLAALQVNQSGGINGQPIKLIIDDVQTDPQTALTDLQNLYSVQGVQVVIGPPTTQQVLTVEQYATQNHILLVTSSATAGQLTNSSPYLFRTVPSDNIQAQAVAAYVNAKGYSRVAIVTRNDAFGQGLANSLSSLLGSKIVTTILIQAGQTDYTSQMQQVKAANPDVIFYDEFVADGIVVFKNALSLNMQNIPTVGSIELQDPSFFKDPLAAQYMQQTNLTGPSAVSTTNTAPYVNFEKAFNQTFGFAPGLFTSTSYDAAMLAFQAIARAGVYNATAIRDQMVPVSMNYVGPSGFLQLNNAGDVTQVSYTFYRVVKVNATGYGFTTFGSYSPATGINLAS